MAIFYFPRRAPKLLYYGDVINSLTLGAHAHSEVVVCVCMCVCVTTHNCRLTHWNHKTEIPTCSQQYSDRFKFSRFS